MILHKLPVEIIVNIISFLNDKGKIRFIRTCKELYSYCNYVVLYNNYDYTQIKHVITKYIFTYINLIGYDIVEYSVSISKLPNSIQALRIHTPLLTAKLPENLKKLYITCNIFDASIIPITIEKLYIDSTSSNYIDFNRLKLLRSLRFAKCYNYIMNMSQCKNLRKVVIPHNDINIKYLSALTHITLWKAY